jgi:type I restriction enzyme S subunit
MDKERRALPEGWEWKRLGDVAQFFYGYPFDSSKFNDEGHGIPLIRIRNLIDGKVETHFDGEFEEAYIIRNGDILIGMDGEFNIVKWTGQEALLNQRVCKLNIISEELVPAYAYRVLVKILKRIEDKTPSVTVKHLSAKHLNSIQILLPPLPTQRRIASLLEKAEETKRLRAQADELTDRLLQSVFLEMFGDSIKNSKGWELVRLGELGEWTSGGTPTRTKPEYFQGNIPWFSAGELNDSYLLESKEQITQEALEVSSAKLFPKETMLIGMYDSAAFKMGLLLRPASSNQACAAFIPKKEKLEPLFALQLFKAMKPLFLSRRRGVRQKNLSQSIIKNFEIPIPPLPLQKKFARIVEKVETMRQAQKQSQHEIDNLFNTSMQKSFKGELTT